MILAPPPVPEYLRNPNYYRLGHQLVALRANQAASRQTEHDGRLDTIQAAVRDAEALLAQARETLAWFETRQLRRRWRLSTQDRRLQRFLGGTVEPCVVLGLAGLQIEGDDPVSAYANVNQLLSGGPRAAVEFPGLNGIARVTVLAWSSRAFYNLACFGTLSRRVRGYPDVAVAWRLADQTGIVRGPRRDDRVPVDLWALERALERVHGTSLEELLQWIQKDPALQPLSDHPMSEQVFAALLERYEKRVRRAAKTEDDEEGHPPEGAFPESLDPAEWQAFRSASRIFGWDPEIASRVFYRAIESRERAALRLPLEQVATWQLLWELESP